MARLHLERAGGGAHHRIFVKMTLGQPPEGAGAAAHEVARYVAFAPRCVTSGSPGVVSSTALVTPLEALYPPPTAQPLYMPATLLKST